MKKYICLFLCIVCFSAAIFITYEKPMAGKGKGKNETVSNMDELATVIDGVTAMMNMNFLSAAETASEKEKSDYNSVTLEASYNVDALASVPNQSIRILADGAEVWYVDCGGDRLYVECSGNISTIDHLNAGNNSEISLKCAIYYGKDVGWFLKYSSFQMTGAALPGQILNKWISLESFDEYMDATKMFSQLLGNTYSFFLSLDQGINEKPEEVFDVSETMYKMKDDAFKKLATDLFNQSPDMPELGVSFEDLNDVKGFLKADLSEKDAPHLEYFCDMDYRATISNNLVQYITRSGQDITLKNINNTVVAELDLSQVYDVDDLMIGG